MRRRKKRKWKKEPVYQELSAAGEEIPEQFLPAELLEMMGIYKGSRQPEELLAEQKELHAVILHENIVGFEELIHKTEIKEVYRLVNQTLFLSIPVIDKKNGIIDSFRDAGAVALFTGQVQDGLDAAISICEEITKFDDWERYQNFAVGLSYGTVMAGIVGYGKRLSVLTLSTYMRLGEFLQKAAPGYYARILAAGSYAEKIGGFEKHYNHRLLGLFYIRETNSTEKVFDIFDGDRTSIRNSKRKTKMLFEKGVGLFIAREFAQARGYFIEVLKADRNDKAAREYVFLCDKYSSMPPEQAALADVCLACL